MIAHKRMPCTKKIRLGLKSLQESVDLFGANSLKTVLNPDLRDGADPDDFFSKVPYGKYKKLFCM